MVGGLVSEAAEPAAQAKAICGPRSQGEQVGLALDPITSELILSNPLLYLLSLPAEVQFLFSSQQMVVVVEVVVVVVEIEAPKMRANIWLSFAHFAPGSGRRAAPARWRARKPTPTARCRAVWPAALLLRMPAARPKQWPLLCSTDTNRSH